MRPGKRYAALAPAAFDEDVAVVAMGPARGYPDGVGTRWDFPTARLPGVGMAVPAVVTADPDVIVTGTYYSVLHDRSGRRYLHHYFGLRQTGEDCRPYKRIQ